MVYGYYLYSDVDDKRHFDELWTELTKLGVDSDNIFSDSDTSQVNLNNLLSSVKTGDTIITIEALRLTHSTKLLCRIIKLVHEKKLELIIGSSKIDCRHTIDPAMDEALKIISTFSDMEKDIRSLKIKLGMKKARARGDMPGRPKKTTIVDLPELFTKYYHLYEFNEINQEELALLCKVTRQTVSKYISIYKTNTDRLINEHISAEIKKERRAKEERQKSYRRMDDIELERLAEGEAHEAEIEGISSHLTPATKELERRAQRINKARMAKEDREFYSAAPWPIRIDPNDTPNDIDYSEFDI